MKVAYVSGYWATNIGNAFFNMGADYVLKKVFGENNVNAIFDQPAGIFRSLKKNGNPRRALNLIKLIEVDLVVLLGPVLNKDFLKIWGETIIDLERRNIKYALLSCGYMKSNKKIEKAIQVFLEKHKPFLVTTRDRSSFNKLQFLENSVYDGIDFAFFVPDAHRPVKLIPKKILALNFDKFFEPRLLLNKKHSQISFAFDDILWNLSFNKFLYKIGAKTDRISDALVYLFSLFPTKDRPTRFLDYTIIRPDHRFTPIMKNKVYRFSNSFVADVPHSYLDIYANSKLTLSDRIHACVIALAYGNNAMLFSKTNRSKLLDRVGATDIHKHPVRINIEDLKVEKENLITWLRSKI